MAAVGIPASGSIAGFVGLSGAIFGINKADSKDTQIGCRGCYSVAGRYRAEPALYYQLL